MTRNDLHVGSVTDAPELGGTRTSLVCRGCGYGVVVAVPPMQCPMCRTSSWRVARRARLAAEEDPWLR